MRCLFWVLVILRGCWFVSVVTFALFYSGCLMLVLHGFTMLGVLLCCAVIAVIAGLLIIVLCCFVIVLVLILLD